MGKQRREGYTSKRRKALGTWLGAGWLSLGPITFDFSSSYSLVVQGGIHDLGGG